MFDKISSLLKPRTEAQSPPSGCNPPPGPPPNTQAQTRTRYNPPSGPPPSPFVETQARSPTVTPYYNPPPGPPPLSLPIYTPAAGQSHETSELNATEEDYEVANSFCEENPTIFLARVFTPDHKELSTDRWGLISRTGAEDLIPDSINPGMTSIRVDKIERMNAGEPSHRLVFAKRESDMRTAHYRNRGDACFTSNLPIMAGQYNNISKRGVYFEITIHKMRGKGTIIALGMQCLPYPPHRLPGWHRRSAALHLDDRRIYFEDSEGGKDYTRRVYDEKARTFIEKDNIPEIKDNDTLGCGYEYPLGNGVGHLFYTYNGELLPIALPGIFDRKKNEQEVDVFAAVGVTNSPCEFDINFGFERFKWAGPSHLHKGIWNAKDWNVDGLFKEMADASPPQYEDTSR